ncbi:MAG TPA: hypothetical protein VN717_03070 [Gemmatimonadaceae bacterium]|nr:hypothetical protein [Gemmatimonadaceae bacterium]
MKICIALAPIARARGGALCVPPAVDTCAPSSRSSSQTGATHEGSFALSSLASNAGLRVRCAAGFVLAVAGARFAGAFFAATFFAAALFAAALFDRAFLAGVFFAAAVREILAFFALFLAVELRRFAMERLPATWTVDGTGFPERVIELAAAITRRLERILSTHDAELVVEIVRAEPSAHRAPLGDALGHGR